MYLSKVEYVSRVLKPIRFEHATCVQNVGSQDRPPPRFQR